MNAIRLFICLALAASLIPACASAQPTAEAQRITMDFQPGQEPSYQPGSLNYRVGAYHDQPVVFRTVWDFPAKPSRAVVRIQADFWCFVWVNGRCVVEHVRADDKQPHVKFPLEIDLAEHLEKGQNVVAVSCTKEGFALAGLAEVEGRTVVLASRAKDWQVWKFAPLTILEAEPFLTRPSEEGIKTAACRTVNGQALTCTPAQAEAIALAGIRDAMPGALDDMAYKARLLVRRGVVLHDADPRLWMGPETLPAGAVAAAEAALEKVEPLGNQIRTAQSPEQIRQARRHLDRAETLLHAGQMLALQADRVRLYHLLAGRVYDKGQRAWQRTAAALSSQLNAALVPDDPAGSLQRLEQLADRLNAELAGLEKTWGHPLNELNRAVANKAGWTDDATLVGSAPAEWGVRVNPIDVSWKMDLAGKWRFKLDPDNTGLAERVHEFGYNIANQWPELTVPGTWEKQDARFQVNNPRANAQSPFPGVNVRTDGPYNGFAWYRKKILVPKEWAGYDLQLYMGAVDDWDWAYWNGKQVGKTTAKTNPKDWWSVARTYTIPKEQITFGGYNVIAVRVYDCGAGGGILGGMELRCPALQESYENKPTEPRVRTRVSSSPLSPAAHLTVGEKTLEIYGWDLRASAGPDGMSLDVRGRGRRYAEFPGRPESGMSESVVYDRAKDGPLAANWALLWAQPGRKDGELPIQLIFLDAPSRIRVERTAAGTRKVLVDYPNAGAELLMIRPIRRVDWGRGPDAAETIDRCTFWSRAALAWPIQYAELARPNPKADDELLIEDVYDYRLFEDDWNTEPVRLAPLPPLACYGLSVDARGLACDAPDTGLSLGDYGTLRAARAESIRYTVPLDTLPRLAGFTSFCFSGADVGTRGNIKEIEILAWTGANSYRPQSNDRSDKIMQTVQWTNRADMNFMFNIDNTLGAKPEAIDHWVAIGNKCKDLPDWAVAYDLINEPANMPPDPYNAQIRKIVQALRKVDDRHMIYVETPHSFASIDQFINLDPVDDEKVVYTFHDYDYRLKPRWPLMDTDIRNMQHQWLPAFRYAIKHDAPICLSEYGGFHQTPHDPWNNPSAMSLLADFFQVFDQFGFHHHYYSNRGEAKVRADGSIRLSNVHRAYRRLFDGDTFYRFRDNWHARIKQQADGDE